MSFRHPSQPQPRHTHHPLFVGFSSTKTIVPPFSPSLLCDVISGMLLLAQEPQKRRFGREVFKTPSPRRHPGFISQLTTNTSSSNPPRLWAGPQSSRNAHPRTTRNTLTLLLEAQELNGTEQTIPRAITSAVRTWRECTSKS